MRLTISAALVAASILAFAQPALAARHNTQQQQWTGWQQPAPAPVVHEHRHRHVAARTHAPDPEQKIKTELNDLRRELDDLKHRISANPSWEGIKVPFFQISQGDGYKLASLPDLRQPIQDPIAPVVEVVTDVVKDALAYLKATATPGYTMARQGVDVAIGRLHPAFAVRLADGIRWARDHGLPHAGVYSAYRPPAFGVGGFGNKFFSMHSYGLAADMTGIGGPGARIWQKAVDIAGLFLPYGIYNRAEFNHVQLLSSKMAWLALRHTITASAPKDLREMWLASGVKAYVPADEPRGVAVK